MAEHLRITRGERGPGWTRIGPDEWRRAVESFPDMRVLNPAGRATWDRGSLKRAKLFELADGEVVVSLPSEQTVRRMIALADRLGVQVVGPRGEAYRVRNNVVVAVSAEGVITPFVPAGERSRSAAPKPWWRFW
ncbi:hypothetical protein [Hansschlegelia sp. KR7-227]|jgi:hypothetical protein|uniref:hypothetical protein n=1 Tax=Hansschlegelia sp. KR7-227 TaxID=3400914 RepID=UPI003BFC2EED